MILKTTDRDGSTRVEQVSRFQRERILREIVQDREIVADTERNARRFLVRRPIPATILRVIERAPSPRDARDGVIEYIDEILRSMEERGVGVREARESIIQREGL